MYKISTLNKISPVGLARFTDAYEIVDGANGIDGSSGVLVRSQAMHDMQFDESLLAIARAGAGVNNIPLESCADQGIVVFNTPGANANAVKELIIGALVLAARNLDKAIAWTNAFAGKESDNIGKEVEKGKSKFAGTELKGKTISVFGLGAIGILVCNAASDLGMDVIGYDPYLGVHSALRLNASVKIETKPEAALAKSDYASLHLPSLPSTNGMFNAELLSCIKPGAIFLNFSRDKLVDEDAMIEALESGKISKYITDFATNGIIGRDDVVCMPHLGASTEEAEDNCAMMAAEEIMDYLENGNIRNSVNFPAVDLGPIGTQTRVALITKNEPYPAKLAAAMFADKNITAIAGATRGEYGYALVATDDEITEIPKLPEVLRVRVLTTD
jgi:hypothetical protein